MARDHLLCVTVLRQELCEAHLLSPTVEQVEQGLRLSGLASCRNPSPQHAVRRRVNKDFKPLRFGGVVLNQSAGQRPNDVAANKAEEGSASAAEAQADLTGGGIHVRTVRRLSLGNGYPPRGRG